MRRVLVNSIGIGRGQEGGKILIARRPGRGGSAQECKVVLSVITNGIKVIGPGPQPTVAGAIIQFDSSSGIRMIRVRVSAALVVRRTLLGKGIRWMLDTGSVGIE